MCSIIVPRVPLEKLDSTRWYAKTSASHAQAYRTTLYKLFLIYYAGAVFPYFLDYSRGFYYRCVAFGLLILIHTLVCNHSTQNSNRPFDSYA